MNVQAIAEWIWTIGALCGGAFSIYVFIDARRDHDIVVSENGHADPRDLSATWSALAQEAIALFGIYGPAMTIAVFALLAPNSQQIQPLGIVLSVLFDLIMLSTAMKSLIRFRDRRFQRNYRRMMLKKPRE